MKHRIIALLLMILSLYAPCVYTQPSQLHADSAQTAQSLVSQAVDSGGFSLWWILTISALCIVLGIVVGGFAGFTLALTRFNTRKNLVSSQLGQQSERIRAISRIGAEIISNPNLEDVIVSVYAYLNQLMDAPIFNIGEYFPDKGYVDMRFLIEQGEFLPPPRVSMNNTQRPAVRCVLERRPIVLNDGNIAVLVGAQPESLVYIPLISGERVIGVFSVQSFKRNSYPPENVDLLMAISSYITAALANATAIERVRVQQQELEQQESLLHKTNETLSERNLVLERLNNKKCRKILPTRKLFSKRFCLRKASCRSI